MKNHHSRDVKFDTGIRSCRFRLCRTTERKDTKRMKKEKNSMIARYFAAVEK